MTDRPDDGQSIRLKRLSASCAVITVGVGALVLVRWSVSHASLTDFIPGFVAMNPMTAILFILLGLSLLCGLRSGSPWRTRQVKTLAGTVITIAIIKLAEVALGWQTGVDTWLFSSQLMGGSDSLPNRMAPNTALSMLLLGLGLLFLDRTTLHGHRPSEYLAASAGFISLLALIGYVYEIGFMVGFVGFIPMALESSITFITVVIGLFSARPHEGWMGTLTGTGPGGAMARLMLPGLVFLVIALRWLRYEGEQRGLIDSGFGVALYTLTIITLGTILTLRAAHSLNRAAAQQMQLEHEQIRTITDLKKSEERVRSIINTAYDAFISIDTNGLVIDWNGSAEKMFGWTRNETVGQSVSDLIVPPQHRAAHDEGVRRDAHPKNASGNLLNRRVELTALRRDGGEFPIQMTIWPIGAGPSRTYNAFIADITERVEAEKRIHLLHSDLISNAMKLEHSNKELEAFSYSVSHDLRAPLRHIDGYARMLQEDAADKLDGETRRYLDEISAAARRMGVLIDDLLALSRLGRTALQCTDVDMRVLIQDVLKETSESIQGTFTIGELPTAQADPVLLKQVWANLISNAVKYSSPRGAAAKIEVCGEQDASCVRYRIRDNGVGFDMQYADKLFGVFQRLHSDDEFDGTGVGLAIVKRILTRQGGTISAIGETGVGATFTFTLPRTGRTTFEAEDAEGTQ